MTKYTMDYTCEDCMLYDGMCKNKESNHYQHTLGMMHPMCEEGVREINCSEEG